MRSPRAFTPSRANRHQTTEPEERARLRARLQPVVDKYTQQVGEALVKQAMVDFGKVRVAAK